MSQATRVLIDRPRFLYQRPLGLTYVHPKGSKHCSSIKKLLLALHQFVRTGRERHVNGIMPVACVQNDERDGLLENENDQWHESKSWAVRMTITRTGGRGL